MLVHRQCVVGVPLAHRGMFAHYGKSFAQSQLRRTHYQSHRATISRASYRVARMAVDAVGVSRCIQIRVLRNLVPTVVYGYCCGLRHVEVEAMCHSNPLAIQLLTGIAEREIIVYMRIGNGVNVVQSVLPAMSVSGRHAEHGCLLLSVLGRYNDVEQQFFAKRGVVVNIKFNSHL